MLDRTYSYTRNKVKIQFAQQFLLRKSIFSSNGFRSTMPVNRRRCRDLLLIRTVFLVVGRRIGEFRFRHRKRSELLRQYKQAWTKWRQAKVRDKVYFREERQQRRIKTARNPYQVVLTKPPDYRVHARLPHSRIIKIGQSPPHAPTTRTSARLSASRL